MPLKDIEQDIFCWNVFTDTKSHNVMDKYPLPHPEFYSITETVRAGPTVLTPVVFHLLYADVCLSIFSPLVSHT